MDYEDEQGGTAVLTKDKTKLSPPPLYKVILLNDDYTTKEFVVFVLKTVFQKSPEDAVQIMEAVHHAGKGIAGVYTYDIAASRAQKTMHLAEREGFPLRCEIENE